MKTPKLEDKLKNELLLPQGYTSFLLYSVGLMGGSAFTAVVSSNSLKTTLVTLSVGISSSIMAYIIDKSFYKPLSEFHNTNENNIINLNDYRRK